MDILYEINLKIIKIMEHLSYSLGKVYRILSVTKIKILRLEMCVVYWNTIAKCMSLKSEG